VKSILLVLSCFALGAGLALVQSPSPSPVVEPSIGLVEDCDDLPPYMEIRAVLPSLPDASTVHHYWQTPIGVVYETVAVKTLPDGSLDLVWGFEVKPGVSHRGRLAWKGGPSNGVYTPWRTCP
jgi:hypothetical protein